MYIYYIYVCVCAWVGGWVGNGACGPQRHQKDRGSRVGLLSREEDDVY